MTPARQRILDAAAHLLASAPDGEVSTRAICERAEVTAPTLYHHFGDKDGLLDAVVAHGFEQYLDTKRRTEPAGDPLQDLRVGWHTHVQFGLDNPSFYALMYGRPQRSTTPPAAIEARNRLVEILNAAHIAGTIHIDAETAADIVLAANTGITLTLIAQPAGQRNLAASHHLCDAVIAQLAAPTSSG